MSYINKSLTITGAIGALFLTASAEAAPRYMFEDPFFDSFFSRQRALLESNSGINFYEKGNKFYVEAPLPGVNEKDVTLTVENQILSIRGDRKFQEDEKDIKRYYSSTNSFNYQVALPDSVDTNNPQASFKNGLMTITFDKKEASKPKKIEFTY